MKNRIWKKILAVGVSLLAEAGMLVGCTAQPAVAYGAEMEGGDRKSTRLNSSHAR